MTANDVMVGDVLEDHGLVLAVEYVYATNGKFVTIATMSGKFTVPATEELE